MKKVLLMVLALVLMAGLALAEEEFAPMPAEAEAYEGVWQCGRASVEMNWEEEGFRVLIRWGSSAWEHTEWEYSCYFHEEDNTLVSMPFGLRTDYVYGDDGELVSTAEQYNDGEATFLLDEDGYLIWLDEKENAGEGMRFEKLPKEDEAQPLFSTFGEALDEAGEEPLVIGSEEHYVVALEKDGMFLRAVTELDETAREKFLAFTEEFDFDRLIALQDDFNAYLRTLPVTYTEEITAQPAAQETLDAMVGKTYKDLEGSEFDLYYGTLRNEWLEEELDDFDEVERIIGARDAVIEVENGMFLYEFTLNVTRGEYEELAYNDRPLDALTVTAVNAAGLSWRAADLEYLADGTFTGTTDLFGGLDSLDLGETGDLISLIMGAMNGEEGGSLDADSLIDALIKLVPDKEEQIRQLVPFFMMFMEQDGAAAGGE